MKPQKSDRDNAFLIFIFDFVIHMTTVGYFQLATTAKLLHFYPLFAV